MSSDLRTAICHATGFVQFTDEDCASGTIQAYSPLNPEKKETLTILRIFEVHVGLLRSDIAKRLSEDGIIVPEENTNSVTFNPAFLGEPIQHPDGSLYFRDFTVNLNNYLLGLSEAGWYPELLGSTPSGKSLWRNEQIAVYFEAEGGMYRFDIERAAKGVITVVTQGVHLIGHYEGEDQCMAVCVQRRSQTKETNPGRLDHLASGSNSTFLAGDGLKHCMSPDEAMRAEATQEANGADIPIDAIGELCYGYKDEAGYYHLDTQHVYTSVLNNKFSPKAVDGEAEGFQVKNIPVFLESLFGGTEQESHGFKPIALFTIAYWLIYNFGPKGDGIPPLPDSDDVFVKFPEIRSAMESYGLWNLLFSQHPVCGISYKALNL